MGLFSSERLTQIVGADGAAPAHGVLIVDDESGNLQVLQSMLSGRYRVLQASDGREALEMLDVLPAGQEPSVILSDQRMPRMTGVELFEHVRERLPHCIRIIITGFVDVGAIVDAINRAGIYRFVVKPFDREDLLLTVERAVEAFELRRQVEAHIRELEDKVRERTRELEDKNRALEESQAALEQASLIDPLTGLGNRRFLTRRLDSRPEGDERRGAGGSRVAFLLVDVDHFKSVNDDYGHAAGDAVLSGLGGLLLAHCRDGDCAVRWGGEEFLLRVDVENEDQALALAERLRQAVAAHPFVFGEERVLHRTCSIGIACLPFVADQPDRLEWEDVLGLADAALYRAKGSGRNAACCLAAAGPLPADFERRQQEDLDSLLDEGVLRLLRVS